MKYLKLLPALVASLSLFTRISASAAETNDQIVVMISVDGLAGYYIDDLKADMPNIRSLAREGSRASSMKAVNPTVTWPNHTTLVTGLTPAHHGVVGNNYYDRVKKERIVLIADPVFDKDQIVKVPTLYDLAKAAGMRTAAIRWPATRNAKTLDWTMPDTRPEITARYSTPALLEECQANGFPLVDKNGKHRSGEETDEINTKAFNFLLKKHRPNFALLHLENVDHTEHQQGPRSAAAYAAVKGVDALVGSVWEELETDFPGRATLVVVSDHGFSPIKHILLPNVVLRKAGLSKSVEVVSQGGAAMLYIMDQTNRAAIAEKITKAFSAVKHVRKVISTAELKDYGVADPKDDPHAPDMIVEVEEGYAVGDTASGDLPFEEKPERRGSHGHDASIPDLHATFVICGAGIKPGQTLGEINNVDVAPTIAKLLHLTLPATDGKVLTDVLKDE